MKKGEKTENCDSTVIKGIFHYCNRWCARCAFTKRCDNFIQKEVESLFSDAPAEGEDDLSTLMEFIDSMMQETDCTIEIIPVEINDASGELPDVKMLMNHPMYKRAVFCHDLMFDWLNQAEPFLDNIINGISFLEKTEIVANAVEVIQWNRPLLLSKIYRALSENGEYKTDINVDANGSMKVALVAIDDLFNAWCDILTAIPQTENIVFDILQHLTILKDKIRIKYPLAECFIRPGFDESEKYSA